MILIRAAAATLKPRGRGTLDVQMATRHFRAHQRFALELPITVTSVGRGITAKGRTVDLGIGGGACELDTPLRLGESVEVVLGVQPPLQLQAEVAWVGWAESSAVRLGLRFGIVEEASIGGVLEALGASANVGA